MTRRCKNPDREWRRWALALVCVVSLGKGASAESYAEDAVKSAFLYRFAGYVEWPIDDGKPMFTIAVLGADGVAEQLERLLPLTIKGRPARVRKIKSVAERADSQIVFIGSGYSKQMRKAIGDATSKPILFVTDDSDGLAAGSVINFVRVDRKIRFEVSLAAAQRGGLKISSELLSVAMRVHGAMPGISARCFGRGVNDESRCIESVASQ